MKKVFVTTMVILGLSFSVLMASAQSSVAEKSAELFVKEGKVFDFEEVPEGPEAVHRFEYINKGQLPLMISKASASCGCAVVEWSDEPVLPGNKGFIIVKYSTNGRVGPFDKEIYLSSNIANAHGNVVLHIKGTVLPKNPEQPATGYN